MSSYDITSSKHTYQGRELTGNCDYYQLRNMKPYRTEDTVYYTATGYLPGELLLKRPTSPLSLVLPFVFPRLLRV